MRAVARSYSLTLATIAAACGGSASAVPSTTPAPNSHPLAALSATGAIVVPAFAISVPAELETSTRVLDERAILRELDTAIASALAARGLQHGWILPSELARSYKRNATYATDPYALAEEPLRSATFTVGSRLPEPLASQLRTMIALHEGARLVLLPIQLTYESADGAPNAARASLRVALVDPRFSEVRWVGEVRSDTTSADPHVLTTAIAERLVDLIVSR